MDIRTILVATDFSPAAERAAGVACEFAKSLGSRVVLLHAWHMEIPATFALEGTFAYPPQLLKEVEDEANSAVTRVASELASQHGVTVEGVSVGAPAESAILEEAEKAGADLIILGTHGRTGLSRLVLGSVAERVVRLSKYPVLTVGPHATSE